MDVKLGYNYVVEYKLPSEKKFKLAGYHEEFDLSLKDDYSVKPYLPDASTNDAFSLKLTKKKGEENTFNTKAMPVDLTPLKDFYITSDKYLQKYCIGIIDKHANKYTYTSSAVIKSLSLEIPENDVCNISLDFNCEKFDKFQDSTDYVDGTEITDHAVLPTSEPLSTVDLSNVKWGTISLKPTKLTLKIDYDILSKWDEEEHVMRYFIKGRKITIDMDLAEISDAFTSAIINGDEYDFTFTVGGQQITVKNVKFPEMKLSVKPEDIITTSFTSLEASEIVFGF